jgi:hypothetical protein
MQQHIQMSYSPPLALHIVSASHPAGKMRGATSNLELPKLRFLIRVMRDPNHASVPIKNAGEFGFGCIFAMRTRAAKKAALP